MSVDENQTKPADVNYRKGDDSMNCGMCQNWGTDGKCSVLNKTVPRAMLCDAYTPIESDSGAPAEGVAPQGNQDIMSMLFGH